MNRGRITWNEFMECALEIIDISNKHKDGWELRGDKNIEGGAYLVLSSTLKRIGQTSEDEQKDLEDLEDAYLEESLRDVAAQSYNTQYNTEVWRRHEYHVIYSISYMVPMLCFNAWNNNGSSMSVKEAWSMMDPTHNSDTKFYSTLTQMDHSVLMRPFLTLHPCKTEEFLSQFQHSKNLLVTFLSSMGPVIGLHMGLHYGQHK